MVMKGFGGISHRWSAFKHRTKTAFSTSAFSVCYVTRSPASLSNGPPCSLVFFLFATYRFREALVVAFRLSLRWACKAFWQDSSPCSPAHHWLPLPQGHSADWSTRPPMSFSAELRWVDPRNTVRGALQAKEGHCL